MLRSAPAKPLHTLDGMLMARVCDGDACVIAPVALSVLVYEGSCRVTYWDPENLDNAQTVCSCDRRDAEVLVRMLTAISQVALAPSQR